MNPAAKAVSDYYKYMNINHTMYGEDCEILIAQFPMKHRTPIKVHAYFSSDINNVKICALQLVQFPPEKRMLMYQVCNDMNAEYRWIKFYADRQINSITVEDDAVIDLNTCAQEVLQCTNQLIRISDEAYPAFFNAIMSNHI